MKRMICCLALLSLVVSCDSVDLPAGVQLSSTCLTLDDIINIPLGNAVGEKVWGTYQPATNIREQCAQCSQNTVPEADCAEDILDPTIHTTFTQKDGILLAEATNGDTLEGSIDADGSFIIGTVTTPMSNEGVPTGQGLVVLEGQFVGDLMIATATLRMTANTADGTIDLQSVHTMTYKLIN